MGEAKLNPDAAMHMVTAIYATACNDLLIAYKQEKKAKTEMQRREAKDDIRKLDTWFVTDPYGMLTNPQRIISKIKAKAETGGWFHVELTERTKKTAP